MTDRVALADYLPTLYGGDVGDVQQGAEAAGMSADPEFGIPASEIEAICEAFPTTYVDRPVVVDVPDEIGALRQWQREVSQGLRKMTDIDCLSRAAIAEANARDEIRQGILAAAEASRRKAAEIIVDAVAERAA